MNDIIDSGRLDLALEETAAKSWAYAARPLQAIGEAMRWEQVSFVMQGIAEMAAAIDRPALVDDAETLAALALYRQQMAEAGEVRRVA